MIIFVQIGGQEAQIGSHVALSEATADFARTSNLWKLARSPRD